MIRKTLTALTTTVLLAAGIPTAYADGSASCAVNGGTVRVNVNEAPREGAVSYISIASTVRLDDITYPTASQRTRASLWYEAYPYGQIPSGTAPLNGGVHYAYSSPVDGNGYWNYRINFYYDPGTDPATNPYLRVGHVHLNAEKYNSTSECYVDIYI